MGHLDRYKKSGGFAQLLQLIESFAPVKQEKFISLIDEENPIWAKALREKVLTVERIASWPAATLSEIVPSMNATMLAMALKGLTVDQMNHFISALPAGEKRKIQSEYDVVNPQPNEIVTTHHKLVEAVRKMVNEGSLRLDTIDASAVVNEKIEEALLKSANYVRGESEDADVAGEVGGQDRAPADLVKEAVRSGTSAAGLDVKGVPAAAAQEMKSMQALILNLQKENKSLKGELKVLKDKLEAIRKIA